MNPAEENEPNTVKEKQHYVPKFLLRYFSFQDNQKQIGVLNTDSGFIKVNCPLKGQAYKPFFYGKDGVVEDFIGERYEGPGSQIIRSIIQSEKIPVQYSPEYFKLLEFIMLSHQRTPKLEKQAQASSDWLRGLVEEAHAEAGLETPDLPDKYERKVYNNLDFIKPSVVYTSDLKMVLLRNETNIPFLLTDNPVIKYNQYSEGKELYRGSSGLSSLGLEIFFCLTPNYCLFLYDSWIYKVGSKRGPSTIALSDRRDIEQINCLSFLNCDQLVFFNHSASIEQINSWFKASKKFEKSGRVVRKAFTKTQLYVAGHRQEDDDIYYSSTHLTATIGLRLSFVSQTKQAKKLKLDKALVQLRKSHADAQKIVDKYFP